jgi:CDP-diacylglycerol--serine O-phosphatidyltransferase
MSRLRHRGGRRRFFGRVRGKPVRYITILPSLVTLLNGACGFAAIVFASKVTDTGDSRNGYFVLAGYMILLAMLADMLDGRLARMSHSTSSFGGQLDSLCDVISFGVAPAFLMLKLVHQQLAADGFAHHVLSQRLVWLTALAYISCAAIRLARFNVENVQDESKHMGFAGLPSPAAAGVVVSLVLLQQEDMPNLKVILYALPLVTGAAGVLMVSRIPYPHVVNQYLHGKKPIGYLIKILVSLALVITYPQATLAMVFCGFAAIFAVKAIYTRFVRRDTLPSHPAPDMAEDSSDGPILSPDLKTGTH